MNMSEMRLSDWTVMSDIDGTLITEDGKIPSRNVEAINRFVRKGGHFAFATGRSSEWAKTVSDQISINAPCVFFNGSVLYDIEKEEYIMEMKLPDKVKPYVDVLGRMPIPMGLAVMTRDSYYNVGAYSGPFIDFLGAERAASAEHVDWRDIKEEWYKVLLLLPRGRYQECMNYIEHMDLPGVRFAKTNYQLIEMLPELSSKGFALERLMERTELKRENLAVIGDFYNDLEMIKLAGLGATLCDSPEDLKQEAKIVTGPCADGAVADLIEYLEERYE